jgi:nitrous oxide reductase accessory protein NosL
MNQQLLFLMHARGISMNIFFQCRKLALGCLLFSALVVISGCKEAPLKPVSIGPNDVCYYCKGSFNLSPDRKEEIYAAEMVAKDGFVRKFDDIGCLVANAQKVGKKNIKAIYAVDLPSRAWLPAEQLQFVRTKIATPRNGGILAFRDAEMAKKFASTYKGEVVPLSDLIK